MTERFVFVFDCISLDSFLSLIRYPRIHPVDYSFSGDDSEGKNFEVALRRSNFHKRAAV